MKSLLFIVFNTLVLLLGCSKPCKKNFDYFKVVTLWTADSLTRFNKGAGLGDYAFFDPGRDSVIFRLFSGSQFDSNSNLDYSYRTFKGLVNDSIYLDTLINLASLLKRYPKGDINSSSLIKGAVYCGPEFYIEFKDSDGLHNYSFILDGNDTLENFSRFFYHFEDLPWKRELISNQILNGDSIAVASLEIMGRYKNMETPYIPTPCTDEINFSKIFGDWRTTSTLERPDSSSYYKLTLSEDGMYMSEYIYKGVSKGNKGSVRFEINQKAKTFIIKSTYGKVEYNILKLSDECFEYQKAGDNFINRYHRL